MFKVEKKAFGVQILFDGFIKKPEMEDWLKESQAVVNKLSRKFGVFVDMRTLYPLPRDAQSTMEEGQKLFKKHGMERSVVILQNATLTMQFKHLAKESGIYQWERYIDASKVSNWEEVGKKWLTHGVDPDN